MGATSRTRTWRTVFLTLRDEIVTSSSPASTLHLLQSVVFSQCHSLLGAVPDMPTHEVTSDLIFLIELGATVSLGREDVTDALTQLCQFIQDVSQRATLELNSPSWIVMLRSFEIMVGSLLGSATGVRAIVHCLKFLRCLVCGNPRKILLVDNTHLMKFLLLLVTCSHSELLCSSYSSGNQRCGSEIEKRVPRYSSLWEVLTISFTMIGDIFSRVGSSFEADIWRSTIEVFRKVMDAIASKSTLLEDSTMSRFYASLLNCLHLVLLEPKGSLSEDVAGLVAALQMFLIYGLTSKSLIPPSYAGHKDKVSSHMDQKLCSAESRQDDSGPYRPPHLRNKNGINIKRPKAVNFQSLSDNESPVFDSVSSDSDQSDSDGFTRDGRNIHSSMTRFVAILCIQDICKADPKSFIFQWTTLLPTNEVLQPRKYDATLMTCMLSDPYLKARIAAASTLATMLDGPASVFLQVAEFNELKRIGSFTALSNSIGQILMQLHTGILYLIQREIHSGLLASLFKVLMLLISHTPYSRMPAELLPRVITSLLAKTEEGYSFKSEGTSLQVSAFTCLTAALSTSPPSLSVMKMLQDEITTGFSGIQRKQGALSTIFSYTQRTTNPSVNLAALQVLQAMSHNYPKVIAACWEQVSTCVYEFMMISTHKGPTKSWTSVDRDTISLFREKIITAAIKVLDECLRAMSGYRGTENLANDKLLDSPFASDCIRIKKISSAPSYGQMDMDSTKDESSSSRSGSKQWSEAIEKYIPLILQHSSAMIRDAAVTCFAGMTSSVFDSMTIEKQDFILASVMGAAQNDDFPSVRSAACRAIGVIACFPLVAQSSETLNKLFHAAEINTQDPLILVRITASWAIANICDSLCQCVCSIPSGRESTESSQIMALLIECSLSLTKDGDKVKSNAVRALGNLSRFVNCVRPSIVNEKLINCESLHLTSNAYTLPSSSYSERSQKFILSANQLAPLTDMRWLERMVQAFLSCVATGNVKVQWNVCHALSNLFQNETLKLQDVDWAPSVFSLLLVLLLDSSNFKIKIQAATALAVPSSANDYGTSFLDVLQGVQHIIENKGPDQISAPSCFKYRVSLEKQLTSTMLHVLSLASTNHQSITEFLVKKASFFEEWLKALCLSLGDSTAATETTCISKRKREMILNAIRALVEVHESGNHYAIAKKFDYLANSIIP